MTNYQKLPLTTVLKYYKRADIQQAIIREAQDKEIAVSFGGTGYGKRPDTINYPKDVLEMVKLGATSFHCSEELWQNPLQITTGMTAQELQNIRKGWDLLLDIDCPELEYSKIAADLIVQALRHHDITNIGIKFSGNHGFHIGIPFEAFPETINNTKVKNLFPDGPRRIAAYLQDMIRNPLAQKLLATDPLTTIAQKIKKQPEELLTKGHFDPFNVLTIDTILISTRHLYRMPYSLNEKSGLASIVITPSEILPFDKQRAKPELVNPEKKFLQREKSKQNEARKLLVHAFDYRPNIHIIQEQPKKHFETLTTAIPKEHFPPCIKTISLGLKDGRKRALFILTNFLSNIGWSHDMIENYVIEWNKKNQEPLRETIIQGHLRHHKQQRKQALPPNCNNKAYMISLGVCSPDGLCKANTNPHSEQFNPKIKNPVSYAIRRQRLIAQNIPKKRTKAADNTPPTPLDTTPTAL